MLSRKQNQPLLIAFLLVTSLAFSAGTASSEQSSSETPLLWSYDTENANEEIESLAISDDGNYIAIGTWLGDEPGIYLFGKDSNSFLWKYPVDGYVSSVGISADGNYLAASVSDFPDSAIYLFGKSSNTLLWSYSPEYGLGSIAISGDGNYIAFAESGGTLGETRKLYLFDMSRPTPLVWTADIAAGGGASVSISDDGNFIVVGGSQLYLFNRSSNEPLWTFQPSGAVANVSCSADGSYIAVGTIGMTPNVYLFNNSGNTPIWSYQTSATVSITADGNYVSGASRSYSGGPKGFVLWQKDSGNPQWISPTDGDPEDISLSSTGNQMTGVAGGAVYLFLKESDEPVWVFPGAFTRAVISGNGSYIAASGRNSLSLLDASFDVPSEVWVDDDYCETCDNGGHNWGYDAFNRIQPAVDVLWTGGTVHVASGTYAEPATYKGGGYEYAAVFINRDNVRLIGEGRDTTIIDSDQDANRIIIKGKNCEVAGFTIRNSGWGYKGIYLTSAGNQNVIRENKILNNDTGVALASSVNSIVEDNIIKNNEIGISNDDSPGNIFSRDIITDNGWGITSHSDNTTVKNCLIARNGTGIRTEYASGDVFVNNTVADNNDTGIYMFSSGATIKNSIIWGNEDELLLSSGSYAVTFCNVEGGWPGPGEGNISLLPAFVDAANGNYRLRDYSSCIGVGTPDGAPNADLENHPRPDPSGSSPDVGAYENSLAIPTVPPVTLLNFFGLELGNKWTYEGTADGEPYSVEREITSIDQSLFPATTYVMSIKENGTDAGTEWYEDAGSQVNLWGGTYEEEGERYTLTFSQGLKAAWFPMTVGDHAYSTATTYILGYPFNASLTADVLNKTAIALGFDMIDAYEMSYQLRIWGSVGSETLDFTTSFTWWMAPYLGVVKDQSAGSTAILTSFAIGGGIITQDSDSDGDGLTDYSEVFEYDTHWQYDDTDGDGMPDGWEVAHGLDPLSDDADEDLDKDRISNYEEFLLGSDPSNRNDPRPRALPWLPLLLE